MAQGPSPSRILIVDDDPTVRDVIGTLLSDEGYVCSAAPSAEQGLTLARDAAFELVLADVRMPGRDGMWLLEQLRQERPATSVIVLTAFGDTEAAVDCLRRGAADYLLKPPRPTDLVRAIERALANRRLEIARQRYKASLEERVEEKTAELSRALREVQATYSNTLDALAAALDAREHETGDHSQRVVRFTLALAERLEIPQRERADIARGALLHDIGKLGVPDAILLKAGPLTADEWAEMRRHPQVGSNVIRAIPFLEPAAELVLAHHERWDGGGYPRGIQRDQIPLGARIFSIADTLDAMMSDRPYRKRTTLAAARKEIARCAGTQFDPRCVEAFLAIEDREIVELAQPSASSAA
jgi:response regulator RpfG family c-di-GMP phosphodiesterase